MTIETRPDDNDNPSRRLSRAERFKRAVALGADASRPPGTRRKRSVRLFDYWYAQMVLGRPRPGRKNTK
jgi:hypothetical protein